MARQGVAAEVPPVLGGNQPWKDPHTAGLDNHVVIPAAKILSAVFYDAETPSLSAIIRSQLFQPNDPMGDAVDSLVVAVAGEVIQHQNGSAGARKVMLQR